MVCVCDFEFYAADNGSVIANPLSIEADALEAESLEEALEAAAEWLADVVDDAIVRGGELPDAAVVPRGEAAEHPRRGGVVYPIAVVRNLSDVAAVPATEAARLLGVTRGRVAQLCAKGKLESWKEGTRRMVSLRSILERLDER